MRPIFKAGRSPIVETDTKLAKGIAEDAGDSVIYVNPDQFIDRGKGGKMYSDALWNRAKMAVASAASSTPVLKAVDAAMVKELKKDRRLAELLAAEGMKLRNLYEGNMDEITQAVFETEEDGELPFTGEMVVETEDGNVTLDEADIMESVVMDAIEDAVSEAVASDPNAHIDSLRDLDEALQEGNYERAVVLAEQILEAAGVDRERIDEFKKGFKVSAGQRARITRMRNKPKSGQAMMQLRLRRKAARKSSARMQRARYYKQNKRRIARRRQQLANSVELDAAIVAEMAGMGMTFVVLVEGQDPMFATDPETANELAEGTGIVFELTGEQIDEACKKAGKSKGKAKKPAAMPDMEEAASMDDEEDDEEMDPDEEEPDDEDDDEDDYEESIDEGKLAHGTTVRITYKNPRTPIQKAFDGKVGNISGEEKDGQTTMYRVMFRPPVKVPGVGDVTSDLWAREFLTPVHEQWDADKRAVDDGFDGSIELDEQSAASVANEVARFLKANPNVGYGELATRFKIGRDVAQQALIIAGKVAGSTGDKGSWLYLAKEIMGKLMKHSAGSEAPAAPTSTSLPRKNHRTGLQVASVQDDGADLQEDDLDEASYADIRSQENRRPYGVRWREGSKEERRFFKTDVERDKFAEKLEKDGRKILGFSDNGVVGFSESADDLDEAGTQGTKPKVRITAGNKPGVTKVGKQALPRVKLKGKDGAIKDAHATSESDDQTSDLVEVSLPIDRQKEILKTAQALGIPGDTPIVTDDSSITLTLSRVNADALRQAISA